MPKSIAIDFDGVIHRYSKGWQDGSIYDEPVEEAFNAIRALMEQGYCVFILTTRSPRQVKKWLLRHVMDSGWVHIGYGDPTDFIYPKYGFTVECIPFWKKFWNKKGVLGITKRKLPAQAYVDDRAIKFNGSWMATFYDIKNFKTYQER